MRSIQKDKSAALATFHDTFDLRRSIFNAAKRKALEARENQMHHLAPPETVFTGASTAFDSDSTNSQPEVRDE